MFQRDAVIIGVGRIGSAMLRLFPMEWTVTVVDVLPQKLARLPDSHGDKPLLKVEGDATSLLTLRQANIHSNTLVAVVSGSDTVNREAARLCRSEFGVEEMVVLLYNVEGVEELGLRRSETVNRSTASASLAFNRLCSTHIHAVDLGLGEGEIMQITILEGSPAVERPLRLLRPRRWLVAAVYRDNELVVPHGSSVLLPGDRVLLVGDPDVLKSVGTYLRGGEAVFPIQYGPHIGLVGSDGTREEAQHLAAVTQADVVVDVPPAIVDPRKVSQEEISSVLATRSIGCLVLGSRKIEALARVGLTRSVRKRLMLAAQVPILVSRGSHPYKRVLMAIGGAEREKAIAGIAIDIARQSGASLTALTVLPPSLARGVAELEPMRDKLKRVGAIAKLYGLQVEEREDEGNPIAVIRKHAADFDLLVIGHSSTRRNTVFTPDISLFLLHDAPCSTLFVPWNQASR
jgi:Trk K+ transport system NAD-binding subunit